MYNAIQMCGELEYSNIYHTKVTISYSNTTGNFFPMYHIDNN